jgi:hypothetical protein
MRSLGKVASYTLEAGAAFTRASVVGLGLEADGALYPAAVFVVILAPQGRRQPALHETRSVAALLLPATALRQFPAALLMVTLDVRGRGRAVSSREDDGERGTSERLEDIAPGARRDQRLHDTIKQVAVHPC